MRSNGKTLKLISTIKEEIIMISKSKYNIINNKIKKRFQKESSINIIYKSLNSRNIKLVNFKTHKIIESFTIIEIAKQYT